MRIGSLYQQITRDICKSINKGEIKPGQKIPSVSDLKNQYGVSHITALRVYKELSEGNYIISKRGQGYFVRETNSLKQAKFIGAVGSFIRPLREYRADDNYFNDINFGIQTECCKRRINLISSHCITPLNRYSPGEAALDDMRRAMLEMADSVDGFLIDERIPDNIIESVINAASKPVVIINRTSSLPVDVVTPPNREGMTKGLEMAFKLGYDRFLVCRPGTRTTNSIERFEAVMSFAKGKNINAENIVIIDDCSINRLEDTVVAFAAAIKKLNSNGKLLLVSLTDSVGRMLANWLKENMNMQAGNDFGLLSFDGFGIAKIEKPEITTICSNPEAMGALAVDLLLNRLSPECSPPKNWTPEVNISFGETL
ncbi:MAG: LacI family DNA-binding transcriptional regulator [Victivallaceae bacterium]